MKLTTHTIQNLHHINISNIIKCPSEEVVVNMISTYRRNSVMA